MKLESVEIEINYTNDKMEKLEKISIGDWIDLRAAQDIEIKAGEHVLIPLGVKMKLPEGYEALLAPRSSTFKKWGFLQTNSPGVIDCSYRGEWAMSVYATRDTVVHLNDRICQFRVIENQPRILFQTKTDEEFDKLTSLRGTGGFGSTGV